MVKKCVICGRPFECRPSRNIVTCSQECHAEYSRRNHIGFKYSQAGGGKIVYHPNFMGQPWGKMGKKFAKIRVQKSKETKCFQRFDGKFRKQKIPASCIEPDPRRHLEYSVFGAFLFPESKSG